jgi:long-chain acyl-CoA synthetase
MELAEAKDLVTLFRARAEERGDASFLWAKRDGAWQSRSWRDIRTAIDALAAALIERGIERGDRVALVSENRPEWLIADLAILSVGAITVPVYTTNTVDDHVHVLTNSGAKAAIASTKEIAERLLPAALRSNIAFVVTMETPLRVPQGAEVLDWETMIKRGLLADPAKLPPPPDGDDIACLTYTSGTGGAPRGVMLTHRNILHNCVGAGILLSLTGNTREIFLSFLPLSHSYEHTAGHFFAYGIGADIYYCEGADKLLANLVEVRPTIMTLVPRLYEVVYQRVQASLKRASKLQQRLLAMALRIGAKRYHDARSLTLPERAIDPVLEKLVRDKMRARFGGRLTAMVSGGAALNPDIAMFFHALGLPVFQGYGQTEAAPVISCNAPGMVKLHTVGRPLHKVEVRIAEDGEILARGDLVMKGYWRDQAATDLAIIDGWLHTGDIGRLDEDGYLIITDRKRDVIVLTGGDNVSPAKIQGVLSLEPEIAQAMVEGDKRAALIAILVPDPDFLKSFAEEQGVAADLAALTDNAELRRVLGDVVTRVNKRLSSIERIKGFIIADAPFTIENAMMTPSLKVRRHVVREAYAARLEQSHAGR